MLITTIKSNEIPQFTLNVKNLWFIINTTLSISNDASLLSYLSEDLKYT